MTRSPELLRLSQKDTAQFIIDNPACGIFSDMGFGKTAAVTTAVEKLFRQRNVNKLLVVSTLLVARETWPAELRAWEHTSYLTFKLIAGDRIERAAAAGGGEQVHIINQENFVWLAENYHSPWPYDMVVFDDAKGFKSASRRTKSSKTICRWQNNCSLYEHEQGTRACRWACDEFASPPARHTRFGALCALRMQIKRLVHLTGTPSSKGLLDLWPMIFTLDNGVRLERTYTQYKNKYFNKSHNGFSWNLKPGAEPLIHEAVKDICISIESEAELPELITTEHVIELPPAAASMYDDFEKDLILETGAVEIIAANAGVLAGKLLQICGGAVYTGEGKEWTILHDEKLNAVSTIMYNFPGEPILIGYNFQHELERLKSRFPQGIDIRERKDAVHAWNAGDIPIMFAHPDSAGHGLNLQLGPGRVLIWFGLNWSLNLNKQLNKRLHRPGQSRAVYIYYIVAKGRADSDVMKGVAKFDWTQQQLLEAVKRQARNR